MKRMIGLLLCALLTLCAAISGAENLTGEVVIDGVTFALDAKVLNPETEMTARYKATGRRWGREPKDFFDIGAVMAEPQDAKLIDAGGDGGRMYIVGEAFNRPWGDEHLQFGPGFVDYSTRFGGSATCGEQRFRYADLPDRVANPYGKQLFEGVYRARNPRPEDVPDLEGITYRQALSILESYKGPFETGIQIGEPYYVEAWNQECRLAEVYDAAMGDTPLKRELDAAKAEPDYYVIYLRTYLQNKPALAGFAGLTNARYSTFDGGDEPVNISNATAIVSANGLERLTVNSYLSGLEQKGELSPVLSAQQAFERVQQAQNFFTRSDNFAPSTTFGAVLSYKATITEIAPEFWAKMNTPYDGTYTLIPVWAFHVHIESMEERKDCSSVHWNGTRTCNYRGDEVQTFAIDAITGERVL